MLQLIEHERQFICSTIGHMEMTLFPLCGVIVMPRQIKRQQVVVPKSHSHGILAKAQETVHRQVALSRS